MRTFRRAACAALIATAAPLTLAAAASARPTTDPLPREQIIAGEAAAADWIVQLHFVQDGTPGHLCTGEAISAEWILTAKHCATNVSSMNVYYSNSMRNPGRPTPADDLVLPPTGDVALVHLARPVALNTYPRLADSYTPQAGQTGVIAGYGWRANRVQADRLYKATVNILGASPDYFGGSAVHVQGVTGAANHGDSGGPLVVGGQIVAVCSRGDQDDPGADPNSTSHYANLTEYRPWIRQMTGV